MTLTHDVYENAWKCGVILCFIFPPSTAEDKKMHTYVPSGILFPGCGQLWRSRTRLALKFLSLVFDLR